MSTASTDRPAYRFGWGAAAEIRELVDATGASRILLVTGRNSYDSSGAQQALAPALVGCTVTRFSEFQLNPRIEDVERGVAVCRELGCDLVIAVGGGTALDVAKSVRVLAAQELDPRSYVAGSRAIERRGVPLIAVPTTAGSGSEATQFAVIYVNGAKHSLDHPWVLPEYAIVDPALSRTAPAALAASTGMDAAAHAIESYWSVRSTDESRRYALEALTLAMGNLAASVTQPSDESREAMARAAHLAGMAINITRTTAAHAISYALTIGHGIPHGHAVAITLPHLLRYNAGVTSDDVADPRGVAWVHDSIATLVGVIGASDVDGAADALLALMGTIGLEIRLSALGIRDVEPIVADAFNQRLANNPRRLDAIDVRSILAAAG